jgi:RNA polymerase sigma factor (sigma-70 family)
MEKAPSYRLLDAANFNTVDGFSQPGGFFKKILPDPWWVPSGLSALEIEAHSHWHGKNRPAGEAAAVREATIMKFGVVKKREEMPAEREDVISFEALMLPHLDAAHNLARWLLRNEQDAQDVVQEAFLRAFKSFSGFHGSNGRAWLLTIVRNTSYTLLKKNGVADLITPFDEEIHVSGNESASPATILERSEDAELIREAMEELPAEFREILTLRHQEDLSYKEIADVAQIPPGTVMSRLARARARLKERLAARAGKRKQDGSQGNDKTDGTRTGSNYQPDDLSACELR